MKMYGHKENYRFGVKMTPAVNNVGCKLDISCRVNTRKIQSLHRVNKMFLLLLINSFMCLNQFKLVPTLICIFTYQHPITGCLPIFEDQFKTFFKTLILIPTYLEFKTCMHDERRIGFGKWGIGSNSKRLDD